MANVKISGLPTASTPLTGAELVPVVQSGVTSQTTVSDFGAAVSYTPSGTSAVTTTVQAKLRETVSVKDFGAVGDGVTDDTAAIQAALNNGVSLYLPAGVYLVSTLTIPASFKGLTINGSGYYHYSATSGTILKAKAAQSSIFAFANGADNVLIQNMRLDANNLANMCIDGTYGAFETLFNVGVYNSLTFGIYSLQGLWSYNRIYSQGHAAVGIQVYSDANLNHVECTGGTIPLLFVAGGNRGAGIWANSGSVAQIRLTPFNSSTTHINTSLVNVYAGEGNSSTSTPIIDILGLSGQQVQSVQISNSFLVQAVASTNKINGGIQIQYANDVVISNISTLGMGSYATATCYTDYFIKSLNSQRITINGCTTNGINLNAINLGTGVEQINISGSTFINCGAYIATGTQGANIISSDANTKGLITGCQFTCTSGSSVPYAANLNTATNWAVNGNYTSYANANFFVFTTGTVSGIWKGAGAVQSIANPSFSNMTLATSATAGANGAPPAQVAGYMTMYINGTLCKVPYYF